MYQTPSFSYRALFPQVTNNYWPSTLQCRYSLSLSNSPVQVEMQDWCLPHSGWYLFCSRVGGEGMATSCQTCPGVWDLSWGMGSVLRYEFCHGVWDLSWGMSSVLRYGICPEVWVLSWGMGSLLRYGICPGIWDLSGVLVLYGLSIYGLPTRHDQSR